MSQADQHGFGKAGCKGAIIKASAHSKAVAMIVKGYQGHKHYIQ
jgi:hypothetical protein